MTHIISSLKGLATHFAGFIAKMLPHHTFYLATSSKTPESIPSHVLREQFTKLDSHMKDQAYRMRWEMSKMDDTRISGLKWGEEHFWTEPAKTAKVLHRLGLLGSNDVKKIPYSPRFLGGNKKAHSTYFSIEEKLGQDPERGWISYVNGMGTEIHQARRDASQLSTLLAKGHNLHCVHLPTRQNAPSGDLIGFALDAVRHLAIEGGGHTRASCLIAQQWIDYLTDHPQKFFLQTCHSEGATHVHAALRILRDTRPDLICRLRIITFCPAHIIKPLENEPLEVINFIKLEDGTVNPWGTGFNSIKQSKHVQIVSHTQGHPHDHTSHDYIQIAKPYFERFMQMGRIL